MTQISSSAKEISGISKISGSVTSEPLDYSEPLHLSFISYFNLRVATGAVHRFDFNKKGIVFNKNFQIL